jgi:hypothetical protein
VNMSILCLTPIIETLQGVPQIQEHDFLENDSYNLFTFHRNLYRTSP